MDISITTRFKWWLAFFWRRLRYYWKKSRLLRLVVALLAFGSAFFLQYILVTIPVRGSVGEAFSEELITRDQELIIQHPYLDSQSQSLLFTHLGNQREKVIVAFDRARLARATADILQKKPDPPPTGDGKISYSTDEGKGTPDPGKETAQTLIKIYLEPAVSDGVPGQQVEIRVRQGESDSSSRSVKVRAIGAGLNVRLFMQNTSDSEDIVGCHNTLKITSPVNNPPWIKEQECDTEYQVDVPPDSEFSITFIPYANSALPADNGLFLPFTFGSPKEKEPPLLKARNVFVIRRDSADAGKHSPIVLGAESTDEQPISIRGVKMDSARFRADIFGEGLLKRNDVYDYINLDRIINNPLLAGLLTVINVAIVTWFVRVIRGILLRPR